MRLYSWNLRDAFLFWEIMAWTFRFYNLLCYDDYYYYYYNINAFEREICILLKQLQINM